MASGLIWIRRLLPSALIFLLILPGTGGVEVVPVLLLAILQLGIFAFVGAKWFKHVAESAAGVSE